VDGWTDEKRACAGAAIRKSAQKMLTFADGNKCILMQPNQRPPNDYFRMLLVSGMNPEDRVKSAAAMNEFKGIRADRLKQGDFEGYLHT
jgi:hypothetical protein